MNGERAILACPSTFAVRRFKCACGRNFERSPTAKREHMPRSQKEIGNPKAVPGGRTRLCDKSGGDSHAVSSRDCVGRQARGLSLGDRAKRKLLEKEKRNEGRKYLRNTKVNRSSYAQFAIPTEVIYKYR